MSVMLRREVPSSGNIHRQQRAVYPAIRHTVHHMTSSWLQRGRTFVRGATQTNSIQGRLMASVTHRWLPATQYIRLQVQGCSIVHVRTATARYTGATIRRANFTRDKTKKGGQI